MPTFFWKGMDIMDLDKLRHDIDGIDSGLVSLYEKRLGISKDVAKIKLTNKTKIHNAKRENEVIKRVLGIAKKSTDKTRLAAFHRTIIRQSRELQYEIISEKKELDFLCSAPIKEPINPSTVACAGLAGSYTHIAAKHLYPDAKMLYMHTFDDVFDAVSGGLCQYGVLPMDNTTEGLVTDVQQGVRRRGLYIAEAVAMPVRHCLLAMEGATLESIKEIYSHPQALGQCSLFLKKTGAALLPDVNTSVAAKKVAASQDISKGVIASALSAQLYNLSIIAEKINNAEENMTRFVAVSTRPYISENACRISLAVTLPHETGSLSEVLSTAAEFGLGLVKVQSVPIPQRPWEYRFYIDVLGSVYTKKVKAFLYMLFCELPDFAFLGNYYEKTIAD